MKRRIDKDKEGTKKSSEYESLRGQGSIRREEYGRTDRVASPRRQCREREGEDLG